MSRGTGQENMPHIYIVAGPNGAGKTTWAREFLLHEAECPTFINADLIAAGLNPFRPEEAAFRAGRLMLEEIKTRVRKGESFGFETTLSGRSYAGQIPEWRGRGYVVKLFFLSLQSEGLAIERVRLRVEQGGHNIPMDVIRRRFALGIQNFHEVYKQLVDQWTLYDNSHKFPLLIASGGENE